METLKDFNNSLIRREKTACTKRKNIRSQIDELQDKLDKMKYPDIMEVFKPIFEIIRKKLKASKFVMYGPFGLCGERTIYWLKDSQKDIDIDDNVLGSLCFINNTFGVEIRNENIDTKTHKQNTIGKLNGMNHPSIKINDMMDIDWLLEFVKRS